MENDFLIPDLVLDCLGRKRPEEINSRLNALGAYEWDVLIKSAQQHGVVLLLYFHLKSLVSENSIPPKIIKRLHNTFLWSARRNVLIYHELGKIIETLNILGIPVILLKGAYLAEGVYSNIAMRPMLDLDIMLRKEDLQQGEKALNKLGYSSKRPFIAEVDSVIHQHILPFTKKNAVPVEVHWNIFDPAVPFLVDAEGLWRRAQSFSLAGRESKVLCLEDQLLHLSIHCTYHHCFSMGLITLCDIDQIVKKFHEKINWDSLLARAKKWGFERCIFLTLIMVSELLGTDVPQEVINSCTPEGFNSNVRTLAYEQLFGERGHSVFAPTFPELMETEGVIHKMAVLLSRIFPTRKEMARFYPVSPLSPMLYLYYPVRIKDLLARYGQGIWQVMKKDNAATDSFTHRQKKDQLKAWMRKEGEIMNG